MKYYTVDAQSLKNPEYRRTYRGIKAKSSQEALQKVHDKHDGRWQFTIRESKGRERRYRHAKHDVKARSPWAVMAKNAKRQHFNVIKRWSNLRYHCITHEAFNDYVGQLPWHCQLDDTIDKMISNFFGPYTDHLLFGGPVPEQAPLRPELAEEQN